MHKQLWDIFISHASEDKDEIARPLANALRQAGVKVWYDEFILKPGDSLSDSIRAGQNNSTYALIILSPNFFKNEKWAKHELKGFITREINLGKPIIPVWHHVTIEQVVHFAPDIADKVAIQTSKGLDGIVQDILSVLEEKVEEEVDQIEGPVKEEHPVRETPRREPLWVEGERQKKNNRFIQRIAIAVVIAGVIFFGGWGLAHWTTRPGEPISVWGLFEYTKRKPTPTPELTTLIFISTPTPPPTPTLRPSTPTPTPTRILTTTPTFTPLPPTSGVYSVQVASTSDIQDAERLQQQYGQLGYLAYIMPADLREKGIWYRVCVGNLQTRTEAEILRDELLEKAPRLTVNPFVTKVSETEELIPRAKSGIRLRSEPLTVSEEEFIQVFKLDGNRRPLEYIRNDFEDRGETVIDHATGLMWQKSGPKEWITYKKAQEYVKELNRKPFAGYNNWRLPTIPELMSLLEPERQSNGLFINPMFDRTQTYCWSADKGSSGSAWGVSFYSGNVDWNLLYNPYVRAVRSRQD